MTWERDTLRHKGWGMHNFFSDEEKQKKHNKQGFLASQAFESGV